MGNKSFLTTGTQNVISFERQFKHTVYFLGSMILGYEVLVVIVMSIVLTALVVSPLFGEKQLDMLDASKTGISVLGALYSFALVFRTNICYSRWWEGRTLWGLLIYAAIRVAQLGHVHIENKAITHRVASLAICFAFACKAQLRGNSLEDDEEDGMDLVKKGYLKLKELKVVTTSKEWEPYYFINAMQATIKKGLALNQSHWSSNSSQIAMEQSIDNLSKAIGGNIRVKATGLPITYDDILYIIGYIFLTLGTIAWASECRWYNPVLIVSIYTAIKLLIEVGNNMEDPFGKDMLDLPLEKFCSAIERQICAIETRNDTLISHPEFLSDGSMILTRLKETDIERQ